MKIRMKLVENEPAMMIELSAVTMIGKKFSSLQRMLLGKLGASSYTDEVIPMNMGQESRFERWTARRSLANISHVALVSEVRALGFDVEIG
jgi:hypothetical protein